MQPTKDVIKELNDAEAGRRDANAPICYINDDHTQTWLTQAFGLSLTEGNQHYVGSFTVDFCWNSQKWFVRNYNRIYHV